MTIRALVVDDSLQLRRSVMYALQRIADVICVEAADGGEALRKFEQQDFDVVLTDLNMPVLDGLKLIAHIRSEPENAKVPIIVITTESAEEDRARAMKLGADAYLVKPVRAHDVVHIVKTLLKL